MATIGPLGDRDILQNVPTELSAPSADAQESSPEAQEAKEVSRTLFANQTRGIWLKTQVKLWKAASWDLSQHFCWVTYYYQNL